MTLFAGHYGSGKTNIAVNYAKLLKSRGLPVMIADLDIVNPYFRTKDSEEELTALGIDVIASPYANTNLDAPALPESMYRVCRDKTSRAIIDVGGDDRGALALGRYTPELLEENDFDMLFVVNPMRPLTRTIPDILEVMHEIEFAGGLPFTGIVNNANLGAATTKETVASGIVFCKELERQTGLPFRFTALRRDLAAEFPDESNLLPLDLQVNKYI